MTRIRPGPSILFGIFLFASGAGAGEKMVWHVGAPSLPTTAEINQAQIFDQPLIPSRTTTPAENQALARALQAFSQRPERDDFSSLSAFLKDHPDSAWSLALETQLGYEYYRVGRYSKAIAAWEHAWESGKSARGETSPVLANRAGSELAMMYARLGRMTELRLLLTELDGRTSQGKIPRALRGATEGLWSMEHQPEVSFRCGPLALDRICFATDRSKAGSSLIQNSQSTTNGFSALQVAAISRQLGLNYQVAFRTPGAPVILPAVVHWRVGHYAALTARDGSLLRADDPTFGNKTWLSDEALDDEASGYFLVRSGPLPPGWRAVPDTEAEQVWGKGATLKSDPDATTPYDQCTCSSGSGSSSGMATWKIDLLLASQHIEDTPVGYTPPVGPPINFTVSYDSASAQGLASVPYSNVAADWRINWLAYLTDDPMNPAGDVQFAVDGGGTLGFTDYDPTNQVFQNQFRDRALLVRTSTNSYELQYPDGSKKIFDLPDGSIGTTRRIFMTAIVDPAGNAATIQFDFPGRIASITDAIGQKTRLYYESTYTNAVVFPPLVYTNPLIVSRVVDPFGRTALFQSVTYSSDGSFVEFTNIIDSLGLSSSFNYAAVQNVGWWISNLNTPYGPTTFSEGVFNGRYRANWIEATYPDGEKERVEYSELAPAGIFSSEPLSIVPHGLEVRNYILWARNTYYWDRQAYAKGYSTSDYTQARIYHWTHGQDYTTASPILESFKEPLEHRVWFNYDGQVSSTFAGTSDQPTKIARTLEDGTTQLSQIQYNSRENPTQTIDPLGRTFTLVYATNDIDLTEVRQTRAGQNELLFSATYNAQHCPVTLAAADRQTNYCTYNARGQLLTAVNARGEAMTFSYDTNGYLMALDGPLPGTNDTSRFTYDSVGRLRTSSDQDGYTLTFDYDNLDRLTRITYPDGTFEQVTYNRLDPDVLQDRAGRQTKLTFDSLRQLVSIEDALGRITRYQWCGCGGLESIVDPLGRMTSWVRDLEGRVQTKVQADGSQVGYEYDTATGWLKTIRDEQNQVIKLDYNLDGTIRQRRHFNALVATPDVMFTYDPNYMRMLTMQNGADLTTFTYNPITGLPSVGAGELASIDGPLPNDTVAYYYDELGRISRRSVNGNSVARAWDPAGRLQQMTNELGTFTFGWDGYSSRLSAVNYPNGQHTTYSYYSNLKDQLPNQITHLKPDSTLLSRFTYDYNAVRQITNWTQERAGTSPVAYQLDYDAADQLTNAVGSQNGSALFSGSYGYDSAENLTNAMENGVARSFAYNALNEPATVTNTAHAAQTYEWDAEHRLTAFNQGTHRTEFGYDGFGRRTRIVEKESGSTTSDHRYVWCGAELCEERDSGGTNVLKRFSDFGVQAGAQASLPAGNYFYTRDHLSSVRDLTDSLGQSRAEYDYTPYGVRTHVAGDLDADFGFTGYYVHPASGLNLAVYRAYDAGLARWLSRDPLATPLINLHAYVEDDPVNLWDPLGLTGIRVPKIDVSTGHPDLDAALEKIKPVWDLTPWAKKTTKKVEKYYHDVQTAIQAYNDVETIRKDIGNCSSGDKSWDQLKNSGHEGQEIFDTMNKYLDKLTSQIPGSKAVTGPVVELGNKVLDLGAQYIDSSRGLFGGAGSDNGPGIQRIMAGHDD